MNISVFIGLKRLVCRHNFQITMSKFTMYDGMNDYDEYREGMNDYTSFSQQRLASAA